MVMVNKSSGVINVGGESVDLKNCHVCYNLGAEGCPMGLCLNQQVESIRPTPFTKCTAFKE
jgi:metal-sulfur cluster biosynthetic enzyme